MQDRSGKLRTFFASLVAGQFRGRHPAIEQAFATVERERFAGPGPWSIMVVGSGYVKTPDDDPAFLYQDTLLALDPNRGINIGQPSWHALWLDAIDVRQGETVLQVGAGTGYYSAILARLAGPNGRVHGLGGMLLLTRPAHGLRWPARFVSRARFVCCDGRQDADAGRRLSAAFSSHWDQVKSFRIDDARDDTCWYAGDGWWLSTAAAEAP